MLLAPAHIEATTLLIGAGISAVVAAFVSWLFNFALGGWMEVRKRRAVRHDDMRAELDAGVRTILNAVRLVQESGWSWHAAGNKVTGFEDDFDTLFAEMDASYRSIRTHLAGSEHIKLERAIGWAINAAGGLTRRVKDFRDGAIGYPPEGLEENTQGDAGRSWGQPDHPGDGSRLPARHRTTAVVVPGGGCGSTSTRSKRMLDPARYRGRPRPIRPRSR
jgi:hypothetical protein